MSRNLKSLLLAALVFLFACKKSDESPHASPDDIHGYDWLPDTMTTDSISIDVDSDSIYDIQFSVFSVYAGSTPSGGPYYNYFAQVMVLDSVVSLSPGVESTSGSPYWNCLDSGQVIGPSLNWSPMFNLHAYVVMAGSVGIWDMNTPHGYIALRKHTAAGYRYGWIRLQASILSVSLDAFALNHTAENTIRAGQAR